MHRATKLVYESFRASAGQEEASAHQPATIARIESRRRQRRARWAYAMGGIAAAACFAVVVARVNFLTNAGADHPVVQVAAAQTPSAAPAEVAVPPTTPVSANPHTSAFTANQHGSYIEIDYAAMIAALREEKERLMALPRAGSDSRLVSLFDDGVFDARSNLQGRQQNSLRTRQPQRVQVEFTAFQFQR